MTEGGDTSKVLTKKVLLAVISFVVYALLMTWQLSILLMTMLFIHESGHVWAMRQCGVKTRGFYFIPFFGGAAIADEVFPSRWSEVYIAIMGPIWGLITALAWGIVYFATGDPLWAAASAWGASLNLFNLLPINPLDGGRIFKSIAFSMNYRIGLVFLLASILISMYLTFISGSSIFILISIFGGFELLSEWMMINSANGKIKMEDRKDNIKKIIHYREKLLERKKEEIKFYEILTGNISGNIKNELEIQIKHSLEQEEKYIKKLEFELKQMEVLQNKPAMSGWQICASLAVHILVGAILLKLTIYMFSMPQSYEAMMALIGR